MPGRRHGKDAVNTNAPQELGGVAGEGQREQEKPADQRLWEEGSKVAAGRHLRIQTRSQLSTEEREFSSQSRSYNSQWLLGR